MHVCALSCRGQRVVLSVAVCIDMQACALCLAFSVGSGELTEVLIFVPQACLTSALSTELSFQL